MKPQPSVPADRAACLAVFERNVPQHFSMDEHAFYEVFSDRLPSSHAVSCEDGKIVRADGLAATVSDTSIGALIWGMVRALLHELGMGAYLMKASRLARRDADEPGCRGFP